MPTPPFQTVLIAPQIAGNVGAIMRSCVCFGAGLHLIDPLGFPLDKKALRRAAMDYADGIIPTRHKNFETYLNTDAPRRILLTTRATTPLQDFTFQPGDHLIFGNEGTGAPDLAHDTATASVKIPIHGRSLNLSNSVAISLFEANRQIVALPPL